MHCVKFNSLLGFIFVVGWLCLWFAIRLSSTDTKRTHARDTREYPNGVPLSCCCALTHDCNNVRTASRKIKLRIYSRTHGEHADPLLGVSVLLSHFAPGLQPECPSSPAHAHTRTIHTRNHARTQDDTHLSKTDTMMSPLARSFTYGAISVGAYARARAQQT